MFSFVSGSVLPNERNKYANVCINVHTKTRKKSHTIPTQIFSCMHIIQTIAEHTCLPFCYVHIVLLFARSLNMRSLTSILLL